MLKSLFKQPYKVVDFQVVFDLDTEVGPYAPIQAELENPYPIGQNVFMFPEESNVLVKKIRASFHRYVPTFTFNDDHTIKNWVVNYQLLNRTDGFVNQYPTRVANSFSADWTVPGTLPVVRGVVNTSHPSNDFGAGILCGGIRIATLSALGHDRNYVRGGILYMKISIYYQDLDEKK
jgi:hypothetical protein